MKVVGYCSQCPLNYDLDADVRGRGCPFACKQAQREHPPFETTWTRRPELVAVMCPACGTIAQKTPDVLDIWTECHGMKNNRNGQCHHLFKVKGTGSWIRKWWT